MWICGVSRLLTVAGEERLDVVADEDAGVCGRELAVVDRFIADGFDEGLGVSACADGVEGAAGVGGGLIRGGFGEGGEGAGGDVGEEGGDLRKRLEGGRRRGAVIEGEKDRGRDVGKVGEGKDYLGFGIGVGGAERRGCVDQGGGGGRWENLVTALDVRLLGDC